MCLRMQAKMRFSITIYTDESILKTAGNESRVADHLS